MNITSLLDHEINQVIDTRLEHFAQMHLLIDPKINDTFFFDNQFTYESITAIRDRQDTTSADHECVQLCTINKGAVSVDEVVSWLKKPNSSAIAMIFSSNTIENITKQISNAMFMRYDGACYFLRFYDPKVLHHLIEIFNQKQSSQLLGAIEYWYFWHDKYIALHHQPEIILSDIDYKITSKQWQKLAIAQSYNYYENLTLQAQHHTLTSIQQETLKQLLDWAYTSTYNHPDKDNLDYIVGYAMNHTDRFFESINYDSLAQLINDKIDHIKHYFDQLEKGIEHGIT